jgi:hypothetical protein
MRGVRRNVDKGRSPLCLGEEDAKHILLHCKKNKALETEVKHEKRCGLLENNENHKQSTLTKFREIFRRS